MQTDYSLNSVLIMVNVNNIADLQPLAKPLSVYVYCHFVTGAKHACNHLGPRYVDVHLYILTGSMF